MQVIVLANERQKAELAKGDVAGVVWIKKTDEFLKYLSADAFIDLEYVDDGERNALLAQLLPRPVIINSVTATLQEVNDSFIRINGWNTFLSSPVLEAACHNEELKAKGKAVFALFEKQIEWLPDEPGFITARVVSMIVNEAYLTLREGVSTREEIDTAMKLGTAYPYGPFEWAQKIGLQKIAALLQKLSETQPRYTPAELLVQQAGETT